MTALGDDAQMSIEGGFCLGGADLWSGSNVVRTAYDRDTAGKRGEAIIAARSCVEHADPAGDLTG